jgi:acyl-CoA dehydrogenase
LNGAKLWTTTGSEASVFLVFARTSPERVKGISAFLVEKSSPGLSVGKRERKLGIRASPTTEILLENVEVPLANRLGEEGNGFSIALDTLDGGRLGIASQSLGIARASLELLVERLGEVNAKGRPTSSQATRWQVADLAADLDAYRFLTWRAGSRGALYHGNSHGQAGLVAPLQPCRPHCRQASGGQQRGGGALSP